LIRRYLCKHCERSFSRKTLSPIYRQKKPFLNQTIFSLLMSGNTQRGIARLLHCSKTTVERKFLWLYQYKEQLSLKPSLHLKIDEMESIEHTKLKPVTIPLCVDEHYQILGVQTGTLKAKGRLSKISEKKYGPRADERRIAMMALLSQIKKELKTKPLTITTDSHPLYPKLIRAYFPKSQHIQINSRDHLKKKRELVFTSERKKVFDPLFELNQRCAKLRADIRRLTRRSWCTTKKIENLQKHLELYQLSNNQQVA
jgi:hypothetical protein